MRYLPMYFVYVFIIACLPPLASDVCGLRFSSYLDAYPYFRYMVRY